RHRPGAFPGAGHGDGDQAVRPRRARPQGPRDAAAIRNLGSLQAFSLTAPASGPRCMPDASPLKVLVVEDESLVALDIETMLEEMGCTVVASVPRLVRALDLASRLDLDLAVLDINLAGEVVYPLAFRLAARGIPFLFSTGYSTADLPPALRDRPIVR